MRTLLFLLALASSAHAGQPRFHSRVTVAPMALRYALAWQPASSNAAAAPQRHPLSVLGERPQLTRVEALDVMCSHIERVARLVELTNYSPIPGVRALSATPMLSLSSVGLVVHLEY
jgi:hypothetical protein